MLPPGARRLTLCRSGFPPFVPYFLAVASGITLAMSYTLPPQHDYMVIREQVTFGAANHTCTDPNEFHGQLASIESWEELFAIQELVGSGSGNFWLGGRRVPYQELNADNWYWVDGTPFTQFVSGDRLWMRREPNNWQNNEGCISASNRVVGVAGINDAFCGRTMPAVCKRPHEDNPYRADGWQWNDNSTGKSCYYKYYNRVSSKRLEPYVRKDWQGARDFCKSAAPWEPQVADLVSIENAAKSGFVLDLLENHYLVFPNRPIWMGLQKQCGTCPFAWMNGQPLTYQNWLPGEPSNHTEYDERCGQISHAKMGNHFGGWNDAACTRQRGYLCEACSNIW